MSKLDSLDRRSALALAFAATVSLAGQAQAAEALTFGTNWKAEAEHGGFYQAVAAGIYRKYGIDGDLRMGGPQISNSQLRLGGRIDIIMSSGLEALSYAREVLPFLCIAAIFQKDPQVLIGHKGSGNDSFEKLKGKTILVGASGRVTCWPFLESRFGYSDEQMKPYTFNLAPWLADKNLVQQGFISSEPYAMRQAGADPVPMLIADAGVDNDNTTLATARKLVTEKKDLVQRFVTATLEGWAEYLKGGPGIEAANAQIRKDNPDMTDDKIAYAIKVMNDNGIVHSGDALTLGIGAMTDARGQHFCKPMAGVGVRPAGVVPARACSLALVNKGVGKA